MKYLLSIIFALTVFAANAQFNFSYNPADSSWTNYGGFTLKKLYSQKDSTANADSDFFKFYADNIYSDRLTSAFNDGTPVSILWTTNSGFFKRSPISSVFSAMTQANVISALGYTPASAPNLTAGNRISITGTYPNLTISYIEPTINSAVARTLNSNFTISTTKQAIVIYTVTCSATNPLLAGSSTATAFLEYSINSGSSWVSVSNAGNSNGVGLAVAVALTNGQTGVLVGSIPSNALVRIRSTVTGTATLTYVTGQEIY